MTLISYRKALALSKEAINTALIPLREAKARKRAELEMAKLDEELAVVEQQITEACMAQDVDFAALINLQDRLALKTRTKRQYQEILDQMFPVGE